jgi:hypothetical protein
MHWFEQQLCAWQAEHEARREAGHPCRCKLLPGSGLTLPEKYARLAAIHYASPDVRQRINPWRSHEPNVPAKEWSAEVPYVFLRLDVKKLGNAAPTRIESMLRDVEADLRQQGLLRDVEAGCAAAGIQNYTSPKGMWPARPFDPECRESVPVDPLVVAAVRKVLADWDGENWGAVRARLLAFGCPPAELPSMTPADIRQWFAQFHPAMIARHGVAHTAAHSVTTFSPAAGERPAELGVDTTNPTVLEALKHVPYAPDAIRGDALADKIGVTSPHLRKEIVPALKQLGVITTKAGYQRTGTPAV